MLPSRRQQRTPPTRQRARSSTPPALRRQRGRSPNRTHRPGFSFLPSEFVGKFNPYGATYRTHIRHPIPQRDAATFIQKRAKKHIRKKRNLARANKVIEIMTGRLGKQVLDGYFHPKTKFGQNLVRRPSKKLT